MTRAIDPTRPVISDDGWEHVDSDLFTIHDYEHRKDILRERYAGFDLRERLLARLGPAGRRLALPGGIWTDAPIMVTEFGGINYTPGDLINDAWRYSSANDADYFRYRLAAA